MHRNHEPSRTTLDDALALAHRRATDESAQVIPLAQAVESTLPSAATVPKVTLTTDELHDVVYAASTTYLRGLSAMGRDKARMHAGRIAAQADLIVHAEHTVYREDPA